MTTTAAATSTTATTSSTTASRTQLNANFDTFIKMLTTQLQYQDPTKPLDTAEFTNQLVMYSQVEQQLSSNDKLDKLISLQQGQGANTALSYLGWEVGAETRDLPLQGGQATFGLALDKAAESVTIGIADSTGKVVRGLTVPGNTFTPGTAQDIVWDGKDNNGNQLDDGAYSLQIVATATDGSAVKTTLRSYGIVTGIDVDSSGNTVLKLGDVSLSPDNVRTVRAHSTASKTATDNTSS